MAKAMAKKTTVKKIRASNDPANDSDAEQMNVDGPVLVDDSDGSEPESPKTPKAPKSKTGPANGVQKAKKASKYFFYL